MEFNFDLNHVENLLKTESDIHVGFAADFNDVRSRSAQVATLFVLPLDEQFTESESVNGQSEYLAKEMFAVMILIPVMAANEEADEQIKRLRNDVKSILAGATFAGYLPIKLNRGRVVELNKDTGNLIYQCQFSIESNLTVTTRVIT